MSDDPYRGNEMGELLLISVPFAIVGWLGARLWTVLVPFVFWLGFAWLEMAGVLPGATQLTSALFAGAVGALFAAVGMVARAQLRPPSRRNVV